MLDEFLNEHLGRSRALVVIEGFSSTSSIVVQG